MQFYYRIGETVEFNCLLGLKMRGARRIECLKSGSWSGAIPLCLRKYEDSSGGDTANSKRDNGGGMHIVRAEKDEGSLDK